MERFNPGRLLLRRSLNARIFPQNEAAELGQAVCIPRTYEYLIVDCADPRPPYHRGKLYLKAVVSFFIPSPPSFFLLFSRKRRRKREKLYIPEERDDRSFEKVLLREKGWFHARDIKVRPRKKTPILVIVPSLLQIHG